MRFSENGLTGLPFRSGLRLTMLCESRGGQEGGPSAMYRTLQVDPGAVSKQGQPVRIVCENGGILTSSRAEILH